MQLRKPIPLHVPNRSENQSGDLSRKKTKNLVPYFEKIRTVFSKKWVWLRSFDDQLVHCLLNFPAPYKHFRVFLAYPCLRLAPSPASQISGRKRHAVRTGINRAKNNGYYFECIDVADAKDCYLEIHRDRNELSGLRSLPCFDFLVEGFIPVIVGVFNPSGRLIGFAYGLGKPPYLRFQVSVTSTRTDGARFLLTHGFVSEAAKLGFSLVLPDPPRYTSAADTYYQHLWGFENTNLFATKGSFRGPRESTLSAKRN